MNEDYINLDRKEDSLLGEGQSYCSDFKKDSEPKDSSIFYRLAARYIKTVFGYHGF